MLVDGVNDPQRLMCSERICCDIFLTYFVYHFQKSPLLVLQQCGNDCVVIGGRSIPFEILVYAIDLVYVAQFKCKRKR